MKHLRLFFLFVFFGSFCFGQSSNFIGKWSNENHDTETVCYTLRDNFTYSYHLNIDTVLSINTASIDTILIHDTDSGKWEYRHHKIFFYSSNYHPADIDSNTVYISGKFRASEVFRVRRNKKTKQFTLNSKRHRGTRRKSHRVKATSLVFYKVET